MTTPQRVRRLRRRLGGRGILAIGGAAVLLLGAIGMALAVHDDEFQLDRDTATTPVPTGIASAIYDWESFFTDPNPGTTDPTPATKGADAVQEAIPAGSGFTDVAFNEDWSLVAGVYQVSDPTTFTQSHDNENVGGSSGWRCKTANQVTNKGDITNDYVAVYEKNGKKILYFGLEKDQDSGSNNVGLWLLQDSTVACAGGGTGNGNAFTGNHMVGDVFLVSEFTNGGGVSNIKAYEWVADIDPKVNVTTPGLDPTPFAASADCVLSANQPGFDDRLCATSNLSTFSPPWTHWNFDLGANAGLKAATFMEGGISLDGDDFPQFANACFNKFLFNTRSSPSLTATLYDYSLGDIGTCDGNISITPSEINEVNEQHVFTITATSLSGAVPTSIAITPSVSPAPSSQSTTCASPTLSNGNKTATCTVTINSTSAGTFTANASVTFTYSGGVTVVRDTDPATATIPEGSGGTGPAVKKYVDGEISVGDTETNEVGQQHVFTFVANALGPETPSSIAISADVTPNPTSEVSTCATPTMSNSNKTATCTITINSSSAGVFTANATATFVYTNGPTVTRDTLPSTATIGSGPNGSGPAVKTYVDAKISIAADDINEVGDPHTFTVTVEQDPGTGFVAATVGNVDVVLTGSNGATAVLNAATSTCDDSQPSGDNLNGSGQCQVVFTSNGAGTVTGDATVTLTVGGVTMTRNTNGVAPNSADAVKEFVNATITISPDDTNNIGEQHVFTVNVTATGVPTPASILIVPSVSPTPGTISDTCGTTLASKTASCTITINSAVAGVFTANATATITYTNGPTVTRDTNPATATIGSGPGGSGPAVKTYIAGTLRWLKHDGDGALLAGAEFEVCRTHTFNSATLAFDNTTDVCVTVDDNVAPDADATGGEFELNGLVLGRYTIEETEAPAGYHKDDTIATVELTIANPSNADATTGDVVPVFVNVKAFRMIVLTCDDITNQLIVSLVDFDGNPLTTGDQKDTIGDLPQYLLDKGVTEADICGTDVGPDANPDGIGGASYGDLDEDTYSPTVGIPKAS